MTVGVLLADAHPVLKEADYPRHIATMFGATFEYPCSSAQMFKANVATSSTSGTARPSTVRSTALM